MMQVNGVVIIMEYIPSLVVSRDVISNMFYRLELCSSPVDMSVLAWIALNLSTTVQCVELRYHRRLFWSRRGRWTASVQAYLSFVQFYQNFCDNLFRVRNFLT